MKMNRWIVTYTKHIKQKRKVYQDGILELSGDKVVLYDDCEKLITSRFLKKDEVVECGGMLAFETHLVDIGDPEASQLPSADRSVGGVDVKLKETAGAYGEKLRKLVDEESTLQSSPLKNHSNAVHGSIRVKKQSEQCRGGALQCCPDESQTILKEWNALYTTQITQKSKKYHDGILRLVTCGSHMNQVILLNEDGTVLSSKFLKSVDCIKSGFYYELSNYLVQICEPRTLSDDSHGAPLQQVAGCRSTEIDKLTSNQEATYSKSIPNDIQSKHRGRVDRRDLADGRLTRTNTNSIHEWNALYTTQKTQKAKKYHDGILQLVDCGSHMKQVILLNEDEAVLSSRYLKSVECVKTGQTCEFPNYLVEICVQRSSAGDDTLKRHLEEIAGPRSTCTGSFINASNDFRDKLVPKDVRKGHLEEVTGGINCDNGRSAGPNNRPIRDAFQILSSLKRPVQIPQPSDVVLLDVEKNKKMPEVTIRKPTEDNHIGKTIEVDSNCQGKPPSLECFTSSNTLSGEVVPDVSPAKLAPEYSCVKDQRQTYAINGHEVSNSSDDVLLCNILSSNSINGCEISNSSDDLLLCNRSFSRLVEGTSTDKISTSSSSSPDDHFDADENKSLTDEIMALQQEWSLLSYRVSAIGSMNNPISIVQNSIYAEERHEGNRPSDTSATLCVVTDARDEDSQLQSISKTCLIEDEYPTFDLGFE